MLIRAMQTLCEYRKGEPHSLLLPPQLAQLPGLVFHLRRSAALATDGHSPDRTAYFRLLLGSLGVFSMLVMVQPMLVSYSLGTPPTSTALEPHALQPDRVLVLDTFTQLLVCKGASVTV